MQTDSLEEYFNRWDPFGYIADGAEMDEYNREIRELKLSFGHRMSNDEVADLVYRIFTSSYELDPVGFKEECYVRSNDISEILRAI